MKEYLVFIKAHGQLGSYSKKVKAGNFEIKDGEYIFKEDYFSQSDICFAAPSENILYVKMIDTDDIDKKES
jgi:hypothetical protein